MKYNIQGLADELEVEIESIVGLYASYIDEMREEITELKLNLEKSDWAMLERVIHNIKGVAVNLCIMDVYSEAEKFDVILKKNITSESDEYVSKIIKLIIDSEAEIKKFFSEKGFQI